MQIELIGCTGAGKSTLVRGILQACHEQGIDALNGDDLILRQARLNWVKGYYLIRTLLVDLFSLLACLLTLRKNLGFYLLTFRIALELPATVSRFTKLNMVRNTLKKIGGYEIIRHCGSNQQFVLLDEGTLHTANYLFVHISVEPTNSDISTFTRLVPVPDVVIYLQQDETVLVERTLARGHKRIPDGSHTHATQFIKDTVAIFDELVQTSKIEGKLLIVDQDQNIITPPDFQCDPSLVMALKILRGGIDTINTGYLMGTILDLNPQDVHLTSNMPF